MSAERLTIREARSHLFDMKPQDDLLKVYVVVETDLEGAESTCWHPMLHKPTQAELDMMIQADIDDIFGDDPDNKPSLEEYKMAYSFEVEERSLML